MTDTASLDPGRLARLQAELAAADCVGALLFDPLSLRYATGTSRSPLWNLHAMTRYAFVPAEGLSILFDYQSVRHIYQDLPSVAEIRPAITTTWMNSDMKKSPKRMPEYSVW